MPTRTRLHTGGRITRRCRQRTLILALAILLCPSLLLAADLEDLQTGRTHLEQGRAEEALAVFQAAFRQSPGDPEINFLLGRAAFEAGDYETAVLAFERVLTYEPQALRAKLELARSFLELGDLESARRYFQEVLSTDPPPTVRANIENFLAVIAARRQRHLFSGTVAVGTGWDDNVRAAPADERIETALGDVLLTGDGASPQGDRVDTISFQLNHAVRLRNENKSWQSTLTGYNAFYGDQDDLDLNFFALSSGPTLRHRGLLWQAFGLYNYLLLDSQRYLGAYGGGLSVRTVGPQILQWNLAGKLEEKTFFRVPAKDATNVGIQAGPSWQWGANRVTLTAFAEWENADGDENSYDRLGAALSARRQLPAGFALSLGLRFQDTAYDRAAFPFSEARDDDLLEATLEASKRVWRSADGQQTLTARLRNTYTDVDSNLDLYAYEKNTIAATLHLLF